MFHPDDARALHDAGVAVRVTIPRPERIAFRANYGLDLVPRIAELLRLGLIDVLAGDDVAAMRDLMERPSLPEM